MNPSCWRPVTPYLKKELNRSRGCQTAVPGLRIPRLSENPNIKIRQQSEMLGRYKNGGGLLFYPKREYYKDRIKGLWKTSRSINHDKKLENSRQVLSSRPAAEAGIDQSNPHLLSKKVTRSFTESSLTDKKDGLENPKNRANRFKKIKSARPGYLGVSKRSNRNKSKKGTSLRGKNSKRGK